MECGDLPRRCRALADSLGIARDVSVGICDRLAMPVLIGIVRPLILLPPAALGGWSIEQLEMVLLHELAHLRRWDNLVNLLQRFVESLLFFQPVVCWLSAWVRLERELCCDRLVIGRVGEPLAYAEMLVALSGATHRRHQAIVAMADRQVLTRIRRLLNLEERSMKLTMPEGLGLLGAILVGMSLLLGSHAAQPKLAGESAETIRQALRQAAEAVKTTRPDRSSGNSAEMTLINIAEAMLKLDDRPTAQDTLKRAYEAIEHVSPPRNNMELVGDLIQIGKHQRQAGDLAGARVSLGRAARIVESFRPAAAVQFEIQGVANGQHQGNDQEVSAADRSELFLYLAEELSAAGDPDQARALCGRAITAIQAQNDVRKLIVLAGVARNLFKAGDAAAARDAIKRARAAAAELPGLKDKEGPMTSIAQAMVEIGELDGSMALIRTLRGPDRQKAISRIIESLADDNFKGPWYDPGGIKIVIGAEMTNVKNPGFAKQVLPKLAQEVRMSEDRLAQARLLSQIASLQANAGDFAGARQTADSIPDVKRADFPGPSAGFYDAIKPSILAMISQHQFDAGDKAGREGVPSPGDRPGLGDRDCRSEDRGSDRHHPETHRLRRPRRCARPLEGSHSVRAHPGRAFAVAQPGDVRGLPGEGRRSGWRHRDRQRDSRLSRIGKAQGASQPGQLAREGRRPGGRTGLSPAVPANRRGQKAGEHPTISSPAGRRKGRSAVERLCSFVR